MTFTSDTQLATATDPAGVWRRLGAYLMDCALLFAGLLVFQAAIYGTNPIVRMIADGRQPTGGQIHLWVFATASVPFLLYFASMLVTARRGTIGMRVMKLDVTDLQGGRLGFGRALLRSAVLMIPFEVNHAVIFRLAPHSGPPAPAFFAGIAGVWLLLVIYLASILLTDRRQSVHDVLAGTIVNHRRTRTNTELLSQK